MLMGTMEQGPILLDWLFLGAMAASCLGCVCISLALIALPFYWLNHHCLNQERAERRGW